MRRRMTRLGWIAGAALLLLLILGLRLPKEPAGSASLPSATAAAPTATAAPTPRPGSWTGLVWSAPVSIPDGDSLFEVVPWRGGFVAIGQSTDNGEYVGAAFASADGLTWTRTTDASTFPLNPGVLTVLADRLITFVRETAASRTEAWTSFDGRAWRRAPELTLEGIVATAAARDRTLVAAGVDGAHQQAMWRSVSGGPWARVSLPPRAVVRAVVATADSVLALGRDGEPDTASGGVGARGIGRPAAWSSTDGLTWGAVPVDGTDAPGAELQSFYPVRDGFFAVGSDNPGAQRAPIVWTSSDARAWKMVGPPAHWGYAGANGQQAIVFERPTTTDARRFDVVVTEDGRDWRALDQKGAVASLPGFETAVGQPSRIESIHVASDGVLVIAQDSGHFEAIFGRAIAAP